VREMATRTKKKKAAIDEKAQRASKADAFRGHSEDQLADQMAKLKKEQFNLRFQRANGQLEKTNRVRQVRKDIARISTVLSEQRRKSAANTAKD